VSATKVCGPAPTPRGSQQHSRDRNHTVKGGKGVEQSTHSLTRATRKSFCMDVLLGDTVRAVDRLFS
jgi:hypothetical protein